MDIMQNLKKCIVNSVPSMVIKYSKLASSYETLETRLSADLYISARLKQDSFITYKKFSVSSLIKAGFSEEDARYMSVDKTLIPQDRRELVMSYEREKIIQDYNEGNNYYRMLNGIPDIDDEEYIYLDEINCEKYHVDPSTPIHEIQETILSMIESSGHLNVLYNTHKKEYIKYMGSKKIDIVTARLADNLSLLYFPKVDDVNSYYRDFVMTYDECREYFLTVIYNNHLSNMYDKYDYFIGFSLLIMTVQRLITNVFKVMVTRDFYDDDTVRMFLESYHVPYIKSFPMTQLKNLVYNLNILLAKKSTNAVLFDLMNILGYGDFSLIKYYLVKNHKLDNDNNPLFMYKTIIDEDGNEQVVEDKEAMYELYFKGVSVHEEDIQSALETKTETESYDQFILLDPTWIHDEELKNSLYETDFNYVNTKYMGMNVMYKMHKMIFEVAYLFRMIIDKREETQNISIKLARISETDLNMFEVILVLISLTCKRHQMESNILLNPSQMLHVLGFNFTVDLEKIKDDIRNNSKLDDKLCDYLTKIEFKTPGDVNTMYTNIRDLEELITRRMNETTDLEVYRLYDKLYRTLLMNDVNGSIFIMDDGKQAETYQEYLEYLNPKLSKYVDDVETDRIGEEVEYITVRVMDQFTSIEYLNTITSIDSYAIEGMLKLIKFFKSYTIDIKSMDIIYLMDSRYYNMIRVMTHIQTTLTKISASDTTIDLKYCDIMNLSKAYMKSQEVANVVDKMIRHANLGLYETDEYKDKISAMSNLLTMPDGLNSIAKDLYQLISTINNYDEVDTVGRLVNNHTKLNPKGQIITEHRSSSRNTFKANDVADCYDTMGIIMYPIVDGVQDRSTLVNFSEALQSNKYTSILEDSNILYTLVVNDLYQSTEARFNMKTILNKINLYFISLHQIVNDGLTSTKDNIIISKLTSILNNALYLLQDIALDDNISSISFRNITIYAQEYFNILTPTQGCNQYIVDILQNIVENYTTFLELLPETVKNSQMLILHSKIFKGTKFNKPISVNYTSNDNNYIKLKLDMLYSDMDYILSKVSIEDIIKISSVYTTNASTKLKLELLKVLKMECISIDSKSIELVYSYLNLYNLSIKEISRIISSRMIYSNLVSNSNIDNIRTVKDIILILRDYSDKLHAYVEALEYNPNISKMNGMQEFVNYSNIVIKQLEYHISDIIQKQKISIDDVKQSLELIKNSVDSINLGLSSFIDQSVLEFTNTKPINLSEEDKKSINKTIQSLRCVVNDSISITSRIKIIRD